MLHVCYYTAFVLNLFEGVTHDVDVMFCRCEDMGVTLLRLGLWPATATEPRCAYSIQLLRWLESLMLSGHVSVHSFVEAVRFRNGQSQQQVRLESGTFEMVI